MVSNDTRDDLAVRFTVHEVGSGRLLSGGTVVALGDAVVSAGSIDTSGAQALYLLAWESDRGSGRSHYLAGTAPFSLHDYRTWMEAAGF